MATVKAGELEDLTSRIFAAMGAPEADAAWIAHLLVKSNLRGHDSHGVIRIPSYYRAVKNRETNPRAAISIVRETPVMALVDGGYAFGQVVARRAMEIAIAKAEAVGVGVVAVRHSKHIGRLADYAEMAVRRGLVAMVAVNGGGGAQSTAPFGGARPRLATNPIAFGIPAGDRGPILLDMATSIVAGGKLMVKRNRNEPAPIGWLLDPEGNPTTDVGVFFSTPRGSLLPMAGHKGYGLSLVVEVLSGILTGAGYSREAVKLSENGTFMWVLRVSDFLPPEAFRAQVDDLIRYMKTCPAALGVEEVLVPGEPEALAERKHEAQGITIEEETWRQIHMVAAELGVPIPQR
jgi:uncharacterized oxidoreductase